MSSILQNNDSYINYYLQFQLAQFVKIELRENSSDG